MYFVSYENGFIMEPQDVGIFDDVLLHTYDCMNCGAMLPNVIGVLCITPSSIEDYCCCEYCFYFPE